MDFINFNEYYNTNNVCMCVESGLVRELIIIGHIVTNIFGI